MRLWPILVSPVAGLALVMVACAPLGVSPSGAALYRQNCVICHGPTGAGNGPQGGELPVPPANLRALATANGGVFPTEAVMATIYGYRGKDYEGLMPEFGPLLDSPEVLWTTADGQVISTPSALVTLTDYLETIQDH